MADPDRPRLLLAGFLAVCALGSAVGLLTVSAWLISRASQRPPILFLQTAIVAVRAFGISRGAFRYAERLVGHDAAFRSLTTIRVVVYRRLERLSPAGLGQYRRGDLLARLVGDVDASVDLIVRVILPVGSGLVTGALAAAIGWVLLPGAGLALVALLLVSGVAVPWVTRRFGARAQRERAAAEGLLTGHVVASLAGAPDLLAYGAVDAAVAEVARTEAELTRLDRRSALASGFGEGLGALATGATVAACIGLGVAATRSGSLDGVWLATLALIPLAMADVLSGMPAAALAMARVTGAAERILQVVDAPDPVPAGGPAERPEQARTDVAEPLTPASELSPMCATPPRSAGPPPASATPLARPPGSAGPPPASAATPPAAPPRSPAPPPASAATPPATSAKPTATSAQPTAPPPGPQTRSGQPTGPAASPAVAVPTAELALDGVCARYPGSTADALRDLDLALPPGRRVALVGPSGAGKSTAAAVVLRLLDHRRGSYLLGGADVRDLTEDQVRTQLTAVDQQAHLFDSTIEENLRLANRGASEEQLRAAVEGAALADWVDSLPLGLATRVGAHGAAVSGGQAQRIALARVLLADRPIVVLDEPGEHLDPQMADQVTAAALSATAGRSVLLITHRMTHTDDCDEVIVLNAGAVAQRGAPAELDGWYAQARARERGETDA